MGIVNYDSIRQVFLLRQNGTFVNFCYIPSIIISCTEASLVDVLINDTLQKSNKLDLSEKKSQPIILSNYLEECASHLLHYPNPMETGSVVVISGIDEF